MEEISKYPPGFFKKRDVRGIYLVHHLFSQEIPAQGVYSDQLRIMFFDISRFKNNKANQRHSIHHEIFHMMYEQTKGQNILNDREWASFNRSGFVYGKQNKPLNDRNPQNPYAPNQLGFVTYYAMQSVREDQAEVFACLMQKAHKDLVEKWMLRDEFLRKKIQAIKDFAVNYNTDMDENFWQNIN